MDVRRWIAGRLILLAHKVYPPRVTEVSAAQQGLDLINASIRRVARDTAYNAERMKLDMEYHAQMASLRP